MKVIKHSVNNEKHMCTHILKTTELNWVVHMLLILALERQKEAEFKASFIYRLNFQIAKVTQKSCLEKQTIKIPTMKERNKNNKDHTIYKKKNLGKFLILIQNYSPARSSGFRRLNQEVQKVLIR